MILDVPQSSFCEQIEEIRETESQHERSMIKKTPIGQPTFNIGAQLQMQLKQYSPDSDKMSVNSINSANSNAKQVQEYKKDILKLKTMIHMYFQQFKTIKPSSCEFYRIGRVLGRGAFGKVNLACHKVTEHLVAIKALDKKVLNNEKEQKRRVMQELAILKQSGHDSVVKLYDSFETNKHICFVMELCQGGDLLSYVRKRRKLKEDNAKYLFKMLVEGLHYIHT